LSVGPAFAASKWIYVGTLTLASGDSRVDYVDVENVFKDEETKVGLFLDDERNEKLQINEYTP